MRVTEEAAAMKPRVLYICLLLMGSVFAIFLWRMSRTHIPAGNHPVTYLKSWDRRRAADYLDRREIWWQYWPASQMSHKTICISCHTVVPYAMVRSSLSQELYESAMPAPQKVLMASVETRVGHWSEMSPFYPDSFGPGKAAESRATEAVLNAVILSSYDAQRGRLRPITRMAFDEAWALQEKTGENEGGWKWQNFDLAPFESAESSYLGAALFMLQIHSAPDGYASEPQIQEHLVLLRKYLQTHYGQQPLLNQIYILWLHPMEPSLLTGTDKAALLNSIRSHQRSDGGWKLSSLDPRGGKSWRARLKQRFVDFVDPVESDGYATGLVVVALEKTGMRRNDEMLARGLDWLERHQESDGSWQAYSLNAKRDPQSDVGRFMRDAATAYAVMALENSPFKSIANKEPGADALNSSPQFVPPVN
jgi:squalene-hopene/tetraprenyl-beta-curcumene cyclase